jgi:hypothetical protein
MAQFKAFHADDQVIGTAMSVMAAGMAAFSSTAKRILRKHGSDDVIPDTTHWYRQQALLDALAEVAKVIGESTLQTIGRAVPERAVWPEGVDTIEKGLQSVDIAYHVNHGNGNGKPYFDPTKSPPILPGIGNYQLQRVTRDREVTMVCSDPYPCLFNLGLIDAVAQRFKPKGTVVRVEHMSDAPCKAKGAESCTYLITW